MLKNFGFSMYVSVCVWMSVCLFGLQLWSSQYGNFILGMVICVDHRRSDFIIKIIGSRSGSHNGKFCFLNICFTLHYLSELLLRSSSSQGQGFSNVKLQERWLSTGKREVGLRLKGILVRWVSGFPTVTKGHVQKVLLYIFGVQNKLKLTLNHIKF